ncbi:MAG: hypothetical protein IPL39_11580 [Opitutaceae bacterium]|nr:hypothetical protein [Opitutaceae bacterium]
MDALTQAVGQLAEGRLARCIYNSIGNCPSCPAALAAAAAATMASSPILQFRARLDEDGGRVGLFQHILGKGGLQRGELGIERAQFGLFGLAQLRPGATKSVWQRSSKRADSESVPAPPAGHGAHRSGRKAGD